MMDMNMAAALAQSLRKSKQPTYYDGPPDAATLRALMDGLPPEAPPPAPPAQPGWEKSVIQPPGPMSDRMGEFPVGPGDRAKPSVVELLRQISRALRANTQIGENP